MKTLYVRRFNLTERLAHWANAIPFMTCLLTGTMMAFHERFGLAPDLVARVRTVHIGSACCLITLPLLVWISGDTASLFRWIGGALRWSVRDIVWLLYPLFKAVWWRLRIPAVDRFNAGQKLNMVGMAVVKVCLAISGLQMWLGHGSLLAHYVHIGCYFMAMPLLAGHIFMAALNPRTRHSMRAMTTGWVREDWLRHHHSAWVERMGNRLPRREVETKSVEAAESNGAAMPMEPLPSSGQGQH